MTSKEEALKAFAELPGISEVRAEHLWEAGFRSLDDVRSASEDDLTEVEGIGPKTAQGILEAVAGMAPGEPAPAAEEEPAEEPAAEVPSDEELEAASAELEEALEEPEVEPEPEPEGEPEPEPEVEEPLEEDLEEEPPEEEVYVVKPDPDLPDDVERALAKREQAKQGRPAFVRQTSWQFKKLKDTWREPRGVHSKQRHGKKYRSSRPRVGYRGPAKARGLHPSGFEEVLVHRPEDLDQVDPSTQAARIAGKVGAKKREAILERADELDVHVLNPGRV